MPINSYPSPLQMGNKFALDLLNGDVVAQEKVDGSQFSMRVTVARDEASDRFVHVLECRSHGQQITVEAPEKMFVAAVETAQRLKYQLVPGWIYRGEYLSKPAHNTLCYDRVPVQHIILFDVERGEGTNDYLSPGELRDEAHRLSLEPVPVLYHGPGGQMPPLDTLLQTKSVLGGALVEGVVVKNYGRLGPDQKTLMCKYVSPKFKEVHQDKWRTANPKGGDIIENLSQVYRSEARWAKAVLHLREAGLIEDDPRDLARLFPEVHQDLTREAEEEIKERLWEWAKPTILRASTAGLAEWYKAQLASQMAAQVLPEAKHE